MSPSPKKHDVFISFRGKDTRKSFTSHVHHALRKGDIDTYIDYRLKRGDEVAPALTQAIRDSRISLVIFSKNFAESKWCLNELVEILECREHRAQVVIPVFYNIDPWQVRYQEGSFATAFEEYKREQFWNNDESYEDKVSRWKEALTQAANISGWVSRNRDESQVIENIVEDIRTKLSLLYPNEQEDLIHIDEINKNIESLPKKHSRIGIWGMGGIGKTTIARQMFAKHFAQYDSVCFLEKVSEELERFGLAHVRNKLLGELLKQQITTSDVHGGKFIKRRLSGKQVFIVLDDVDDATQLGDLCGSELGDLGPNSRLIITTTNRHTLEGRDYKIYEVAKWKFDESLKLFSLGAFEQRHPKEGYERLSKRAVAYAGGIPLALKVLGSHLHSKKRKFWQDELNYLEKKEECLEEIQKVLRASYNKLRPHEKEMFLDIAFFFKGENKDFVTRILDACGFNATNGIEMLEDKAFITISNSNRIQMPDLLQKMALDIVRYKRDRTSRDPGKRSRLRDNEEVCDVLQNNKVGTHKVEGIIFDLSQKGDLHVQVETFKMMTRLRFFRLYVPLDKKRLSVVYPPRDIMTFSEKLRYLEWSGYPLKSLPDTFCAKLLVEIRLQHSDVEYLWHGMQELVNLEAIDLSECKKLIKLPDLSRASKLKWLYLSGCESLREVPPCVFSKDTLVTLLLDRCKKLQSLISERHLTSLEKISVYRCFGLKQFSLSSDSIERLDLSNTGVKTLDSSIGGMSKLVWLSLEGLRLTNLPNEVSHLGSLTELCLSNCKIVTKSKLEALLDGLRSLKILYLKDCCNLFELPANISSLSSLSELRLDGSIVEMLPTSIKNLSKLEVLSIDYCKKLGCLPELPPRIKEFHADNCASLVTVSTLKTFSKSMKGEKKYISFMNDKELDGPSLDRIMEDVILTMKSAAFHNVLVRKNSMQNCTSDSYNSAEVCLPGSKVPSQFKYRTTDSSSITVGLADLSDSLGFIFSVVVSPPYAIGAKIQCQCYSEDGRKVGYASKWHPKAIRSLDLDHVFVWYDSCQYDSNEEKKVCFEFCVTTDMGESGDIGFLSIKECGICPIYTSEFPRLVDTINLDEKIVSDVNDAMQFFSKSIEGNDENNGIDSTQDEQENKGKGGQQPQNQELDSCLTGPLRRLWRLIRYLCRIFKYLWRLIRCLLRLINI